MTEATTDAVVAVADLVGRAGATQFEIAWDCPHVPDEGDNHNCPHVTWTCSVRYKGHRIFTEPKRNPVEAANDLATQILDGAMCRCGQTVTLTTSHGGCRWALKGSRWEPGCNVSPMDISDVGRGDLAGMNRAARRRMERKKK